MRQIDTKYQSTGDITKTDGTSLPADEPLILFRGKDKLLPALLEQYRELCMQAGSPEEHLKGLETQINKIKLWQDENPDKVSVPD